MQKRRRIEITAFRSRTTIVLRDRSEVVPTGLPPDKDKASHPVHADPARAAKSDLDQTRTGVPDTVGQLGFVRDANNRRST